MYSSARVKTTLKDGAQAKVTLEATAPRMSGKYFKATVHISGPSSSKVVVSATGAQNKKNVQGKEEQVQAMTREPLLLPCYCKAQALESEFDVLN
jgi:CMP-N-acetylneuraminic acid synthetase